MKTSNARSFPNMSDPNIGQIFDVFKQKLAEKDEQIIRLDKEVTTSEYCNNELERYS